jgi:3,4-dihydroxyphenylacetate 2,3-dioxygenase
MGTLALAAKITHVPSMYLSEFDGPHQGCRAAAIEGHREIDRRCRALGVDTLVVLDVHWQVNSEYHVNCAPRFAGTYTSNELPHFIRNLPYDVAGNPALGQAIADEANAMGVRSRAHSDTTLALQYGTLVPLRYMNADGRYQVVSVAAWCDWHDLAESGRFGLAARRAIEQRWGGTAALLASGSLSHRFADNGRAPEFMHKVWDPFLEQVDRRVLELWEAGDWPTFIGMLPMYAEKCFGEGDMHDTAMLLGALGWSGYRAPAEIVTPYFGSSGTGQVNAILPVTPL